MLICLPFSAQAAERDFFLNILEKSGLRRTQQGAAIILTGRRDVEEEVLVHDLAVIRKEELLNLKKVPHCALQHEVCAALSYAGHVMLYHCQACNMNINRPSTVLRVDPSGKATLFWLHAVLGLTHQELHEGHSAVSHCCRCY